MRDRSEWPEATDDTDREIFRFIEAKAWYVISVFPDPGETGPDFAYSIGLYENFGHPELLVYGLAPESARNLINRIGNLIANRQKFEPGGVHTGIGPTPLMFLAIQGEQAYRDHFGYANWFYRGTDYPAVQCVWADPKGRFPWGEGASRKLRALQPLIGKREE